MKQINFSHEGGFPLEQETLERLQAAYRSELFGALKAHLSIDNYQNYIVAHATNSTKGWAIIQEDETQLQDSGRALPITEGILYPVDKGENTGYLKTTRTGTNLVYGTGVSQIAYYDYEAAYISESEFVSGVSQDSDALKISYHDLGNFKIVKDLNAIEEILQAIEVNIDAIETNINQIEAKITEIESDINVINQTYLPLDGSKAMKGDLDLDVYKLSKLDTKESGFAIVRSADFRLGSITRKGKLNPSDSTGRALSDTSDESKTSLSLNYQSDWQNTIIGGKVHLNDINTSNSTGSLLVVDGSNQVTKSNSLLELLNRITVLESKISTATAFPIGMIAIWGRPANEIPDGWEEYVPLRGRVPVGVDISDPLLNKTRNQGGSKNAVVVSHDHTISNSGNINDGKTGDEITDKIARWDRGSGSLLNGIVSTVGESGTNKNMQPYSVVYFIEYTGVASDKTPPTTPNLKLSNITNTSVDLSWTASSDNVGVTNYHISINGGLSFPVGNVLTYNATGLSPNTTYNFYVIAQDAAENFSANSNIESATTTIVFTPTIPLNIQAYSEGQGQIGVEWGASTDNGGTVSYELFRKTIGGTYKTIKKTNSTFYMDSGSPNTTYYYQVEAINLQGVRSGFDGEAYVTTDPPASSCFDVESLVTMASGQSKKLKNIVVGDKLQAFSFANQIDESEGDYMLWSGKLNEATKTEVIVVNKTTSIQPNYYEIKTADTTLKATEQHPLLVTEDGENVQWVCIKNVTESMFLIDKTGKTKAIESIQFKEEPLEVALLDVETVDNYIISGIVAHNSKP
ncbi:fibronectin type III domain-containing protein [Flavobacterium sp. FlaQc-47]|uniref:fibronectin type III domain-containing protein n=1 Tax=Flavobacterium sp. FlaQc-47 TaxID=3374180 RepID=UPI0037568E5C